MAAADITLTHDLPPVIRAGDAVPWSLVLSAGEALPAGACIGLARNWPSDWGQPRWADLPVADRIAARDSNGTRLAVELFRHAEWHPYDHAILITLAEPLAAGGSVTVELAGGAQTFAEEECCMRVFLRQAEAADWREIGRVRTQVTGAATARLVATAPSRAAVGIAFDLHVRAEDGWGNPAANADLVVSVVEGGAAGRITAANGSTTRLRVTLGEPGVHRLTVRDGSGRFAAIANPIRVSLDPPVPNYWGDLHAQSAIGCGAGGIEAYFRFARDFAALDFAAHQANCFMVGNAAWAETQAATRRFNEAGRFVTLLGYEWSGGSDVGGDHNVYFPGDTGDLRRCSHRFVADRSDADTDLAHVTGLHDHVRGNDRLLAVHVGGRTTDLRWHEPSTEALLEVHSTHATSEWFLLEALRRNWRIGVTGGSDGVDGRPGASRPGRMSVRNLQGGLVAVAMPELTRPALWTALRTRHTYATTGARILLEGDVDGHGFGTDYTAHGSPRVTVAVEGTAPLRSVRIFRGIEAVFEAPIAARDQSPSRRLRLTWSGAGGQGNWERARMVWNGGLDVVDGTIRDASDHAPVSAGAGIVTRTPTHLAWLSITAGNENGVELKLDETPETLLRVATGPLSADFALRDLSAGPIVHLRADPPRCLRLQRLPKLPAAPGWQGIFTDAAAPPGEHAYWVRVEQDDGALAWSSPIYATVLR